METKKNEKYDLEAKKSLFFGIGLILSLLFVISAFEWRSEIEPIPIFETLKEPIFVVPVPITEIPKPPKPKIVKTPIPTIEAKDEIIKIIDEIKKPIVEDEPSDEGNTLDEIPDELPRNYAEVMPSYNGGMEHFYKFISDNVKYPRKAQLVGAQGKVFVHFVVEKDGSLSDIRVVKGIGAGCDEEAIRVMNLVRNFSPGKQGDVRVRVSMVVPIYFKLH